MNRSEPKPTEFNSFLRFLQLAKQLKVLKVQYSFNNDQMLTVLSALRELPNLEEIALGSLDLDKETVLKPIGQFLSERPQIKYCFKGNYGESVTRTREQIPLTIHERQITRVNLSLNPT